MRRQLSLLLSVLIGLSSLTTSVYAGIVPSGTRLVYKEGMQEKAISLGTANDYPVMIQTWVNDGSPESAEEANPPFISYPPMFSLPPHHIQSVKVVAKSTDMPKDRESVYWLNIHEIPPINKDVPAENAQISLATTTQLKIFYRPKKLAKLSEEQIIQQLKQLQFTLQPYQQGYLVKAKNPTPFSASLSGLAIEINGHYFQAEQALDMMVAPLSSKEYFIDNVPKSSLKQFTLKYLLLDGNGHTHLQEQQVKLTK